MTKYKLVPVEPTPEMLGAWYRIKNGHHFHDDPPREDRSDYAAYRAMLAAVPSPAPPTSAEVEEMAIIMFESAGINIRWTDPHVTEGRRHLWRAAARKAISAMNQRRGMERPTNQEPTHE